MGGRLLADCVIHVDSHASVSLGHAVSTEVRTALLDHSPRITDVIVHVEPAEEVAPEAEGQAHGLITDCTGEEPPEDMVSVLAFEKQARAAAEAVVGVASVGRCTVWVCVELAGFFFLLSVVVNPEISSLDPGCVCTEPHPLWEDGGGFDHCASPQPRGRCLLSVYIPDSQPHASLRWGDTVLVTSTLLCLSLATCLIPLSVCLHVL